MMTMKKKIMTMMLMALCGIAVAEAQPHRGLHPVVINPRPMRVTKVVSHPVVVSRTTNRLNQSDRLEMAIAYIKSHGSINAKQYSKITGLNKATAEAGSTHSPHAAETLLSFNLMERRKRTY